jgi:hypothetical protein
VIHPRNVSHEPDFKSGMTGTASYSLYPGCTALKMRLTLSLHRFCFDSPIEVWYLELRSSHRQDVFGLFEMRLECLCP